ncbi:MAG: response regulator, partial [Thermodesulfovibrionales bacterium]
MRESEAGRKYPLVLIVDDDLTMRILEREALEQAGFVVEEAADGIQALAAFRRLNPDIVLFDVMMPEMDGFTLCKEIRKTEGGQLTPLLMVTGLDDLESINRAYEMGVSEFIAKPINWALLGHHVRYMLRSSSAFAALKYSEKALREERDRANQYLDIVGVLVMVLDAAGTIALVNRMGCEILGVKEEEILGKNWFDTFLLQGRRGKAKEDFLKLMGGDSKLLKHYEIPVVTKGGADRILSVHTSLMRDQTGDLCGILFSGEDITERKKMESELVKVEKLESIGILAGGIAHDFNNILTAILGNISLIRMSADPNDKMYERLVEAEKATHRATDLTQQLLTFSKGGSPVKITTSIAAIIKESSSFVLRGSNVKCEIIMTDAIGPIEVDVGQMSQVIQNLVINASQAMPAGGVIRIYVDNFMLWAGAG